MHPCKLQVKIKYKKIFERLLLKPTTELASQQIGDKAL